MENRLVHIRDCVDDILRKRFELKPDAAVKGLDDILGDVPGKSKASANRLGSVNVNERAAAFDIIAGQP